MLNLCILAKTRKCKITLFPFSSNFEILKCEKILKLKKYIYIYIYIYIYLHNIFNKAFRLPIAGMEPYASACKDTREGLKCNTKLIADKYCEESKESLKEDAI